MDAVPMDAVPDPRLLRVDSYDDGIVGWSMARLAPPPPLARLVDGYTDYAERTGTAFTTRRELPHSDGVFLVNLGAPIVVVGGDGAPLTLCAGEAFVAGIHLRPALSCSSGAQSGVHVHLPLESLRRLLAVPLEQLTDRVLPLEAIFGGAARDLCDRLLAAPSREARVAALDGALTRRFAAQAPLPAPQAHALALLRRRPDLDIADIARDVGWSRKHLTARTRDAIGIGPRSFRRVLRFERLTRALRGIDKPDWAGIALDAGYCDQSHMIREFCELAGLTPREYLRRSLPDGGGVVEA